MIFVSAFSMALAACPPKNDPGTTDGPGTEDTTADASTSTTTATATTSDDPTTTAAPTTSEPPPTVTTATSDDPGTTTGETTGPSEPDTTSTTSSTTTLEPDTTGGDACMLDLAVTLVVDFDLCSEELRLVATVQNVGTADLPAGITGTLYEGTDPSGLKVASEPTVEALTAGSSTDVVWVVVAPEGEKRDYYVEFDRGPSIVECDEDNNSAVVTDAACPD